VRDVQTLPFVQENEASFSDHNSFYPLVDALKLAVTNASQDSDVRIFADWSIPPMSWGRLMNGKIVADLNRFGFVLTKAHKKCFYFYENQFHMLNARHPYARRAVREGGVERYVVAFQQAKEKGVALQEGSVFSMVGPPLFCGLFPVLEGRSKIFLDHTGAEFSYQEASQEERVRLWRDFNVKDARIFFVGWPAKKRGVAALCDYFNAKETACIVLERYPMYQWPVSRGDTPLVCTKDVGAPLSQFMLRR